MRALRVLLPLAAFAQLTTGCDDTVPFEDPDNCGDQVCDSEESWHSCPLDCTTQPLAFAGVSSTGAMPIFPNDLYTVEDAESATGRRVSVVPEDDKEIANATNGMLKGLMNFLNLLDGFGTSAGGWVRTSAAVAEATVTTGLASTEVGTTAMMGYYDEEQLKLVPVEASFAVDQPQIIIRPMLPLPESSEAFLVLTSGVTDLNGNPLAPTRELFDTLDGRPSDRYAPLAERMQRVVTDLQAAGYLGDRLEDIAALSVFTTQSITEPDRQIAEIIQARAHSVDAYEDCVDTPNYRQCRLSFTALNFMREDHKTDEANISADRPTYSLNADVFLPLESAGYQQPYPVSIFGHGLTGDGTQANLIARHTAPMGIATIAIDSPQHGDHPMRTSGGGQIDIIMALFGLQLDQDHLLDPIVLRDGWRHSSYDKLALIEVIRDGVDFDDDGTPDLDIQQLSYMGASLGAIQGSEFTSLTPDLKAIMFAVGGARVIDVVQFSPDFGPLLNVFLLNTYKANVPRAYVLIQTMIERGDGANWARHVLNERLDDAPIPHLASQISIPDTIVPNETNIYLNRALGIPNIGEVVLQDELIENISAPTSANHATGVTAGTIQIDWIWNEGSGAFRRSNHDKSPDSEEGIAYWEHFLDTLYFSADGVPELIDPYVVLGRPKPTE